MWKHISHLAHPRVTSSAHAQPHLFPLLSLSSSLSGLGSHPFACCSPSLLHHLLPIFSHLPLAQHIAILFLVHKDRKSVLITSKPINHMFTTVSNSCWNYWGRGKSFKNFPCVHIFCTQLPNLNKKDDVISMHLNFQFLRQRVRSLQFRCLDFIISSPLAPPSGPPTQWCSPMTTLKFSFIILSRLFLPVFPLPRHLKALRYWYGFHHRCPLIYIKHHSE